MRARMREEVVSPDGRHRVAFSSQEVRMSHWIDSPVVMRAGAPRPVLDLTSSEWSADDVRWLDASRVSMALRRYPGDAPGITLILDADARQVEIRAADAAPRASADGALRALEAWYRAHGRTSRTASSAASSDGPASAPPRPSGLGRGLRLLRAVLLLLLGFTLVTRSPRAWEGWVCLALGTVMLAVRAIPSPHRDGPGR
jgi:hypothetical protein